jgi:hypothetical protein
MKSIPDRIGLQYGQLTIIELTNNIRGGKRLYLCFCSSCQKTTLKDISELNRGGQCGCSSIIRTKSTKLKKHQLKIKYCLFCGRQLLKSDYPKDTYNKFINKKYCNYGCKIAGIKQNSTLNEYCPHGHKRTPGRHCLECARIYTKGYNKKHKEIVLEKEKQKRQELHTSYLASVLRCDVSYLKNHPELIQIEREKIQLKRIFKEIKKTAKMEGYV